MIRRNVLAYCLFALLLLGRFSEAAAQNSPGMRPIIKPPDVQLTVTGKLIKVMAIGGETTGWALDLDKPRQIGDKTWKRLEVDPAGQKLGDLENKRLEVTGNLQKCSGIERKEYWVLVVKQILVLSD
jgi:hypothetical protein